MRKIKVLLGILIALAVFADAETLTNDLDMGHTHLIKNHPYLPSGIIISNTPLVFTNAGFRDSTISIGQLIGVNPATGVEITNSAQLLPLKAQSVTVAGDIIADGDVVASGYFIGDGSQLTGIPLANFGAGLYIGDDRVLYSTVTNELDQVYIGIGAGLNNTNDDSVFVGVNAGRDNQGDSSVLIGEDAGLENAGDYVVFVGEDAGYKNTGNNSVGIGRDAGRNNTANYLTALGRTAGANNSGRYATLLGASAGRYNAGERVLAIGYKSGYANASDDRLFIDMNNTTSNTLIYGEFDNDLIRINGDLDVTGNMIVDGAFFGNGAGLSDFDLSAYAGDHLTWSDGKLNAQPGYSNSEAIAAVAAHWTNLDTNVTDDFGGSFANLTDIPSGLSDGDDNTHLSEQEVRSIITESNELTFTNQVTVSGQFVATYIPPQGDLLMGNYTNGLPQ
jgi:hypothetical protein